MGEFPTANGSSFFAGHLGHLTEAQQEALATFRQNLEKAKLYTSASADRPASHDEPTLLRFLRARGFQPTAAQKQFTDAEAWRKKHDVDNLFATFDSDEFEKSKRYYPRWTGRRDKNGLPLYVYRLASLPAMQKEIDAVPAERKLQRIIVLYEQMCRFSFALCSHLPHPPNSSTPISCTTSIIDLDSISFTSLWSLRGILQESSQLATANYPETLGVVAVVNSPSFFPTIWGWIKGWFDEGTRNKIHVLGRDPGPKLRELIDAKNLPKTYGGELDWKFEDEPALDEDAKAALGTMPTGPAIFVNGSVQRPEPPKQNGQAPKSSGKK
ncbi:hypothetical protein AX16_006122 [Volvariella volvacea WC 439]|nr:hypothetical protein AX16_006122 [Volvariella volvacea WC 439]